MGEGFCDAFRYFMEKCCGLHETSDWFNKIDSFAHMTPDAILRQSGDERHDRIYGIPASRIIQHSGRDFDEFRALWTDLVAKRAGSETPILDSFFNFAPVR
ncbi:MAG TPA: hypothetical protein VL992_15080 [Tepidisphaeraceae bacterium]|nr:hypothetical protein [Tepidisphaeraceae bacterium]